MPPVNNTDGYQQIKKKLWLDAQGDLVGSASEPTLAFGSSNNTGIYESSDGTLVIVSNGTAVQSFSSGSGGFTGDLTITGNLVVTGTITGNATVTTDLTVSGSTNLTTLNAACVNNTVVCNNNEIVFVT